MLVPTQEGVGRGDSCYLFEALAAKRVGERREAAAFGVGEPQAVAGAVGFQDAIFLVEIGDDVLLVLWDLAGDHGDEDVEDHSRS